VRLVSWLRIGIILGPILFTRLLRIWLWLAFHWIMVRAPSCETLSGSRAPRPSPLEARGRTGLSPEKYGEWQEAAGEFARAKIEDGKWLGGFAGLGIAADAIPPINVFIPAI
jgi:hypothetical protein